MNVIILAQKANTYSTQRLVEAWSSRNHSVQVINPLHCTIDLNNVIYNGETLITPDVTMLRSTSNSTWGKRINRPMEVYVATQFQLDGSLCINPPEKKRITTDKMLTLQHLAHTGISRS